MSETNLNHTVFVFRDTNTGEVVICYSDSAQHYVDSSDYEHIATINPMAWIKTYYDTIYGGKP